MKRYILLVLLALLLATLACSGEVPPGTPTAPPDATETPTGEIPPTATEAPTETPPATQTPVPAEWYDVPIINGDFDAELPVDKNQPGTYMNIFQGTVAPYNPLALAGGWLHRGWSPLYCNTPYVPERCQGVQDILYEDGIVRHVGNVSMDYPEYKDAVGSNRVIDGTNGQQLFRPFAPYRAGIWQSVEVPPDSTCEITALVQSWSATEWVEGALSNFPNTDAFNQSGWRIGIKEDPGPIYRLDEQGHVAYGWFQYGPWQIRHALDAADVQASEWYTGVPSRAYQSTHGMALLPTHYDEFQRISATIDTGNNNEVVVFVENMTLFGFRYTDRYIESVSLRCRGNEPEPFPTPTPIVQGALGEGEVLVEALRIHDAPDIDAPDADHPVYGKFVAAGQTVEFFDVVNLGSMGEPDLDELWLQLDPAGNYFIPWVHWACEYECVHVEYAGGARVDVAPQSLVSQGEMGMLDVKTIVEVLVFVLALIPLLGGAVGGLLSAALDLLKAILHGAGVEMPDEFWGRAVLVLNVAAVIVLRWVLGADPYTTPLPDNLAEIIVTATSLLALITQFIGQLGIGKLLHWFLKLFAPTAVSTSARKQAEDLRAMLVREEAAMKAVAGSAARP